MNRTDDVLKRLEEVILSRTGDSPESSYTASLLHKGVDKILKKLGEEATELIIAGKGGVRDEIVYETADLFYHTLVLLRHHDISLEHVYAELARRFGMSGLEEKRSRGADRT
jgi:phosphoribosyl-ATP pyrophosphohydrolase